MGTKLLLLGVNVALAALAAFLGALAYAQEMAASQGVEIQYNRVLFVTAGYAALRAAIGLGSVYADKLSSEIRTENEAKAGV